VVEYVSRSPNDALLRLDKPGPGVAALGTVNFGGQSMVALNCYPGASARTTTTTVAQNATPGVLRGSLIRYRSRDRRTIRARLELAAVH
jgi:hypothetical protein